MQIDLSQTIFNVVADRNWFREKDGAQEDLTLKMVIMEALSTPVQEPSVLKMVTRFDLIKKVKAEDGFIELTVEQVALIKELLIVTYTAPHLVGAVFEILEGVA